MLGVFAEFETNLRKERQLEGIAKAKASGVYKGRKPSIDVEQVRAMKAQGVGPEEPSPRPSRSAAHRCTGRLKGAAPSAVLSNRFLSTRAGLAQGGASRDWGTGETALAAATPYPSRL